MGLFGVVALAAWLHAPTLWLPFVGDDLDILVRNEAVVSPEPWHASLTVPYWNIPHGEDMGIWRPVTTGVFSLVWQVVGERPWVFHGLNVLLHAANAALVAVLAAGVTGGWGAGLVAGAVFAVHPVHVEAVANVVGMAELLSALAVLAACVLFQGARARGGGPVRWVLVAWFALAVGAKESGAMLPFLLLLVHEARADTRAAEVGTLLRRHGPLLAALGTVLLVSLWFRSMVLGGLQPPIPPVGADLLSRIPRIHTVAGVWPEYLRLLAFPIELSLDYSPGRIPVRTQWDLSSGLGAGGALSVLGLALWGWRRGGGWRTVSVGIVWFTIAVVPISNLPVLSGVLLAERTLYLPSVGFALVAAGVVRGLIPKRPRRIVWALGVCLLALAGARTVVRIADWRSEAGLWRQVAQRQPENGRGHQFEARALWAEGEQVRATHAYARAFGRLSGDPIIAAEVAQRLFDRRAYRASEAAARIAWEKTPDYAAGPALLALALLGQGRDDEALRAAEAAVAAEPDGAQARELLEGVRRAVEGRGRPESSSESPDSAAARGRSRSAR